MFNNDYLPSLTTSDLLGFTKPFPVTILNKAFETLNGIELPSMFSETSLKESKNLEKEHKLKFKVPGYEKNEITVTIENSDLSSKRFKYFEQSQFLKVVVVAQNKEEGTLKQEAYFPHSINESTIEAKLNNGILTIAAKVDPQKSKERQIQIS